jgi:hypothetical protein
MRPPPVLPKTNKAQLMVFALILPSILRRTSGQAIPRLQASTVLVKSYMVILHIRALTNNTWMGL